MFNSAAVFCPWVNQYNSFYILTLVLLSVVFLVELHDAAWALSSGAAPFAAKTEAAARPQQHEPSTLSDYSPKTTGKCSNSPLTRQRGKNPNKDNGLTSTQWGT